MGFLANIIMKTILICNQKGGVGKSLIADELVFSFERTGIAVAFYDLDGQGGTIHQTNKPEHAEVAIIDTPGALQEALQDWLHEADMVVIPTRTTSRDIDTLMRMRKVVHKNCTAPVLYVMNGWNRWKAAKDFLEWFNTLGEQQIVILPQSEVFVKAAADERSVIEYAPKSKVAKATLAMVNVVREMIGFDKEYLNN